MNQNTNMAKYKNKKYYQKNNSKDTQFLIFFPLIWEKPKFYFFEKKNTEKVKENKPFSDNLKKGPKKPKFT